MLNGGKWMSSLDLYRFHPVLIVGPQGHHWLDAGERLAAEFRLEIHRIGADADRSAEAFLQAHGISKTGAILIRPDGFVAWRATSREASPIGELADALGHVLARPIQSPFAGPCVLKALPVAASAENPGQHVVRRDDERKVGY